MDEQPDNGGDVQEESSEDAVRDGVEGRERLSNDEQYAILEEKYRDILPKHWDTLSHSQQLDWFAHRMLLDMREKIREEHGNKAAKEFFMSDYQLERRRRREVQSKKLEGWDDVPPRQGVFSRRYVDPNELRTGRSPDDDGQKNP